MRITGAKPTAQDRASCSTRRPERRLSDSHKSVAPLDRAPASPWSSAVFDRIYFDPAESEGVKKKTMPLSRDIGINPGSKSNRKYICGNRNQFHIVKFISIFRIPNKKCFIPTYPTWFCTTNRELFSIKSRHELTDGGRRCPRRSYLWIFEVMFF